jgi:hypothetical protein
MTIEQIEQQLADLRVRVEELESHASTTSSGEIADPTLEAKVLAITQDLFAGAIHIEVTYDPQEPERKWRLVCVAVADADAIDQASSEWRRRVFEELGPDDAWRYSLSLEFGDA